MCYPSRYFEGKRKIHGLQSMYYPFSWLRRNQISPAYEAAVPFEGNSAFGIAADLAVLSNTSCLFFFERYSEMF